MKLIDTHCHVGFQAYAEDAAEVIKRARAQDVTMITVGTQLDTSRAAAELANAHEGVYATIGLHPTHAIAHGFNDTQELSFKPRQEVFDPVAYGAILASSKKIVAVGECGLDYYRLPEEEEARMKKMQYEAFAAQRQFAIDHNLPIVIHCRDAHADQLAAIKELPNPRRGVIHCFTGTYEEAKAYVELGWIISFSGIAVFADAVGEVAAKLPLDSLVIETDSPYLTPPPYRGKRNEPLYVQYVAQDIARRRKMTVEDFAAATTENASKMFGITL
jgi:TatD DNase family protein